MRSNIHESNGPFLKNIADHDLAFIPGRQIIMTITIDQIFVADLMLSVFVVKEWIYHDLITMFNYVLSNMLELSNTFYPSKS